MYCTFEKKPPHLQAKHPLDRRHHGMLGGRVTNLPLSSTRLSATRLANESTYRSYFGYPTNQSFSYPSTINSLTTCSFSTSCSPAAPFHIRN